MRRGAACPSTTTPDASRSRCRLARATRGQAAGTHPWRGEVVSGEARASCAAGVRDSSLAHVGGPGRRVEALPLIILVRLSPRAPTVNH